MRWRKWFYLMLLILAVAGGSMYLARFHYPKAVFPVRGEFVQVGEHKIYTTLHGEGRTVLFLHGFPYHSDSFSNLANKPLPGYQFITMDLPGLGLSSKHFYHPPTPDDLALTVKLFLDRLGDQEVILVGHDLGGSVALICAVLFPQRVKGVVLIAPDSSFGQGLIQSPWWWRFPVVGEIYAALTLNRDAVRGFLRQSWSGGDDHWQSLVERYTWSLNTEHGRQAFLDLRRGSHGFHYLPYEERLQTRGLLIWGENDTLVPVAAGKRLAQVLTSCEWRLVPGAGHTPHEEKPDEVYRLLSDFLNTAPQ